MNVQDLLQSQEGKTLEFKRDVSSPEPILKTIISFANSAGGIILIGVEDKTKRVRGVINPLEIEEKLANLISDTISPLIVPEIEIVLWRNTPLIAIKVFPSPNRPHFLRKSGSEKGVFIRVGSTNRNADLDLINELKRSLSLHGFDEEPLKELNSEAIDFLVASDLFSSVRTLKKKDLETLKILTRYQGKLVPTVGGVLLFGKEHKSCFPDAWVQCGRFNGNDRRYILDTAELHNNLVANVYNTLEFVKKHALRNVEITGKAQHTEKWSIPAPAFREAIINAIVHADYSQKGMPIRVSFFDNRIEIENPGLLPVGLTIEDILNGVSKLRNRVIGRVFKELNLIEQWGSGIQRIVSTCKDAGLEVPLFEEKGVSFRVTIFTTKKHEIVLDTLDNKICTQIGKSSGMSTKEISECIGITTRATRTRLSKLLDRGIIISIGKNPQDPKKKFFLATK